MQKFVTCIAALLIGASALFAQSPYDHAEKWNVSITGGGLYSAGENHFSYKENGRFYDQINWQGAIAVGYDFSNVFGARLWAGYGKNAGAGNVRETAQVINISAKSKNTSGVIMLSLMGIASTIFLS